MARPALGKNRLLQRQIPTILGIVVLVIGLGAGLFFFSDGLGVFAPRAAPEATPRNVKITNVTDNSFTVSFLTESSTPGYVRYGSETGSIDSRAGDDRDQLAGSIGEFPLHHVTIRGLEPSTTYYFTLGTEGSTAFDNDGQPYSVQTARRGAAPPAARTVYGSVVTQSGAPADGTIVYVSIPGAMELSTLVKSSGSWAVPLSTARTESGDYAAIDDATELGLFVQGLTSALTSTATTTVADAQPAATITLGSATVAATQTRQAEVVASPLASPLASPIVTPATSPIASPVASPLPQLTGSQLDEGEFVDEEFIDEDSDLYGENGTFTSTPTGGTTSPTGTTQSQTTVNLTQTTPQSVTTSQPRIVGAAAPQVIVNIQVNSETQIIEQVVADEDGNFELDLSTVEGELEPGQHTVTYSYTDPTTGQLVTRTQTFTVQASTQLATTGIGSGSGTGGSTTTTSGPFSTSSPVPIGGTATQSATPSAVSSPSARPASGSAVATTSAIPKSGSVSTTAALVMGGAFFLIAGGWSFWASREWQKETA